MSESVSAQQHSISERLAKKAKELPTLGKIIRGEVSMELLGETGYHTEMGQLGTWNTYRVRIPEARPNGEAWDTFMNHWRRLPLALKPYEQPQRDMVTILTGHGEMPFSSDPEVVSLVIEEMERQAAIQKTPPDVAQ